MRLKPATVRLGLCELAASLANTPDSSEGSIKRQSPGDPPDDKFLRRGYMAIAATPNFLYIVGGHLSQLSSRDEFTLDPVQQTLALPLEESWDVADVEIVTTYTNSKYPTTIVGHSLVAGRLGGRDRLWSWGGFSSDPTARLYVFTPDGEGSGEWSSEPVSDSITRGEHGVGVSCEGSMVYFGGRARNQSDDSVRNLEGDSSIALPGVITYNFENGTWTNMSSVGYPDSRETYQKGELICAGVQNMDPMVFAIGGATIPPTNATDESSRMLDMSTVMFWNMKQERWYEQSTVGGRKPADRQSFCAVGASSQNGTYEIFVYGGWDKDESTLDDIWILSLPAFRWFQTDAKSTPRFEHQCHRSGDQMISVGGNDYPMWGEADELERGIGIFNLTSLEWQTNYVADQEYDSPDIVKEWYSNGGLEDVVWENNDVKAFFIESDDSEVSSKGNGDNGDSGTVSNDDTESDPDGDDDDTPVGAIAGGVVGGIAALALAGFLFWFMRRRRPRQHEAVATEMPPELPNENKHISELPAQGQYYSPQESRYKQIAG